VFVCCCCCCYCRSAHYMLKPHARHCKGTSTHDGYAIASATLRHLASRIGCGGLFATHYHQLTAEFGAAQRVRRMHMKAVVDRFVERCCCCWCCCLWCVCFIVVIDVVQANVLLFFTKLSTVFVPKAMVYVSTNFQDFLPPSQPPHFRCMLLECQRLLVVLSIVQKTCLINWRLSTRFLALFKA
jgi:hypothetical protein